MLVIDFDDLFTFLSEFLKLVFFYLAVWRFFLRNQLGSDRCGILLSLFVFSSQRSDPGFPRYKYQERREWSKT